LFVAAPFLFPSNESKLVGIFVRILNGSKKLADSALILRMSRQPNVGKQSIERKTREQKDGRAFWAKAVALE
jgi:hypothetical protein